MREEEKVDKAVNSQGLGYLKNYSDIVDKIVLEMKEGGIDKDIVRWTIHNFFLSLKGWLDDPRIPIIKIVDFGTIGPTIAKIRFSINALIRAFRKRSKSYTYKLNQNSLNRKIRLLWGVYKRLREERAGKITYNAWLKNKTYKKDILNKYAEEIGYGGDGTEDDKATEEEI